MKTLISLSVGVLLMWGAEQRLSAGPVSLGEAQDFVILGLEGGTVTINSATSIDGNVGYGKNVSSNTNQKVDSFTGSAFVHSTASFNYAPATYAPSGGILMGSAVDTKLEQAVADALAASVAYASLTPTQSLGALGDNDSRIVISDQEVNVISLASLNYKEDTLELVSRSGFNDYFIFNVAGDFDFSASEIKLSGVSVDHVLFHFANASDITINKADNIFLGTILAPLGSVEYHNPATFEGAIIAKNINVHSDFNIGQHTFESVNVVPEPASFMLASIAAMGLIAFRRRRP